MTSSSDHHLLFGIIALQMDFVRREQLVAAASTWLTDKSRNLEEILVKQGALSEDDRRLLAPLVARHLENHGGDPQQSLATLSGIGSVADELRALGDESIDATLPIVACNQETGFHEARTLHHYDADADTRAVAQHAAAGRFRIIRSHAKGGLGEVYVAKDTELNRDVALKEIQNQYADDEASRLRFLLEAEVTGGLEHPGIVPVYGLGRYDDGRPFYAMRFIKGDSLQEATDRFHLRASAPGDVDRAAGANVRGPDFSGLEFRKLLGRFLDVCQAIAYAHSRGVLHRDLKPGNIMLGKYGETLVVDWGLARAQGRGEGAVADEETTLRPASASGSAPTMMGSAIGTPAFMPPEQAAGRLDELGPASDVYSLGATLYYMLTGKAPFLGKDLGEILRQVQAGEFPNPRESQPQAPRPLVAICLRATATERTDRYASPQAMADDLERYLADEPVTACTEPLSVRGRRWLRKHPKSVAALCATILVGLASASVIAAVVSSKNAALAEKNQQLTAAYQAEMNAKQAAQIQRNRALAAEQTAKTNELQAKRREQETAAVFKFFAQKVLSAARPKNLDGGLGIDVTIRAAVDAAEPTIAESFQEQPLVDAHIRSVLGRTYYWLGEVELAIDQQEQSRALFAEHLGPEHATTLAVISELALSYQELGKLDEAVPLMETALQHVTAKFGPEHPKTLTRMNNLAVGYHAIGKLNEAMLLLEKTLELKKVKLGDEHDQTRRCMNDLALVYQAAGKLAQAEPLLEECLRLNKSKLSPEHPDTITCLANLAAVMVRLGKAGRALPLLEEAFELQKATRGADHPQTLNALNNLASGYIRVGKHDQALPLLEEALRRQKAKFGPQHPSTLGYTNNLAIVYLKAGEPEKALPLLKETVELFTDKLGPEHINTLISTSTLAGCYWELDQLDRSVPLFESVVSRMTARFGADHPDTLQAMSNLGVNYRDAGELEKAVSTLEQALKLTQLKLGEEHSLTHNALGELGATYLKAGRIDRAFDHYRRLVTISRGMARREAENSDRRRRWMDAVAHLADAYQQQDQCDKAIAEYESTIRDLEEMIARGLPRGSLQREFLALRRRITEAAFILAARHLLSGDSVAYQRLCSEAVARHQDSPVPRSNYLVGRLLSLSATRDADHEQAVAFATRGAQPTLPWRMHGLGLALMRAGQLKDAMGHFSASLEKSWNAHVVNWLGLALAHHRGGDPQQAAVWFEKATEWIADHPLDATSELHSHDKVACQLLLREAQNLLGKEGESSSSARAK